jgi:hypothetical protein
VNCTLTCKFEQNLHWNSFEPFAPGSCAVVATLYRLVELGGEDNSATMAAIKVWLSTLGPTTFYPIVGGLMGIVKF